MNLIPLTFSVALLFSGLSTASAQAGAKEAEVAFREKKYQTVFESCKKDADAGEKICQFYVGHIYKNGLFVQRDLVKSVEYLKKCADQGVSACEEGLADNYRLGLGVEVNYSDALRLYTSASLKGNLWAFNGLGVLYRDGLGVPKNLPEAVKNFEIAANKGNPSARTNLAELYRSGSGVSKNAEMAFSLAEKAAGQDWGHGWNQLGLYHRDGVGTPKNIQAAVDAFKKAVRPGVAGSSTSAYFNLAQIYYSGNGVPSDMEEAAKFAEAGARLNHRESMNLLAYILATGSKSIQRDPDRAYQLAINAHNMGLISAKNTLGYFYRDGIGTPQNIEKAAQYFKEGADAGLVDSMVNLGRLHLDGRGVQKNPEVARQFFTAANSKRDLLGPSTRSFVDNYFSKQVASERASTAAGPVQSVGPVPSPASNGSDAVTQALMAKIDAMQRQLEQLQTSGQMTSQTASLPSASDTPPVLMAVRRALVIGNDKYLHVPPLRNAKADALAIADKLKSFGYNVTLAQDVDEKEFKKVLRNFRTALEGGEEVLFFFAGHGVQLGSANYLLPTDIRGDNEEQVKDEGIELQRVLDDLKSKNSKFALAIIDACRDNPFPKSGRAIGGRGLAPTTAATGQMVMFSAGAGQQALDSLGASDKEKNGLFTRILLAEMSKPNVAVDRVLRNVRNEVVRLSKSVGHEQTPALYDQAVGDFYFKR